MSTAERTSFRIRLAWQTMLVAGLLVALFGCSAWWYARTQLARNLDLRITEAARRLWSELTPRSREAEFAAAARQVLGGHDSQPAALALSHVPPHHPYFSSIANLPAQPFLPYLPTGEGVITTEPSGDAPQAATRGTRLRPQMAYIRDAVFLTARIDGEDWRYGSFSNPNYTLFIGLSAHEFYADVRQAGLWLGGAALVALALGGLGAWWLSARAMRPLDRVLATAEGLGAGSLDERIPLHDADDREFARLILALNAMTDRLQLSFHQAARFTADASHELKTPLAAMQGTLHELLRDPAVTGAVRERVEAMLQDNTRLKHITQSLLLLSQADSGKLPIQRQRHDLTASLAGLLEDAESLCEAHDLTFQHHIAQGIHIEADPALMRQVFQNLLGNAIKHNHPGGSVRIDLARDQDRATLTFTNTGSGIPPEAQARLFERFFRADSARHTEGFGLGLNIAYELARANEAELRLIRSDEHFTSFVVTMKALPD